MFHPCPPFNACCSICTPPFPWLGYLVNRLDEEWISKKDYGEIILFNGHTYLLLRLE